MEKLSPEWTTLMIFKRKMVIRRNKAGISGTDLEEILRSTGDHHEFQENRGAYGKCNFSPSGRGLF